MITCILIDDEENCRIALREMLKPFPLTIIGEFEDANLAHSLIHSKIISPDIVFLDIQMPKCDGFSFLQKFEHIPFKVVFTTAYDQFAIKAIQFSALDYLLKPISQEDLENAVSRILKTKEPELDKALQTFGSNALQGKLFEKIAIHSLTEIIFVALKEILCFQSDNNYTFILLRNGEKILSSKNIGYYENILEGQYFFRVHNSYIINLNCVKKYIKGKTGLVELDNGTQLSVSTRRKDEFLALLNLS